ncbi:spore photoproduct lyase [Effusibacillus lacus]|uniref:Spore photoproduct lyase n=1 Tax=Effusibacillus lacus TaxID=1348429 RepID=A0A292YKM5_9BACL|nr:spore photoproduct lyase [Effusibacillus lacus]TCS75558.1 spore photoproduct lyase [Effusibacillus lacus]GAX89020.1 spore photoproduct lyase [Effusibacillus lacus]
MKRFNPDLVFFEPDALNYPLGKSLHQHFQKTGTPIKFTTSHNRVTGIPGETEAQKYRNAKNTLVVGVRKTLEFDTSKPSAEYAIPLTTGCAGHCHYCYLQTTMGSKPYIRVYVNLDEILAQAKNYIEQRKPEITRFEAACTGDPVSLEHLTGALEYYINFFGKEELGRLRFVTKFANIESLLEAKHNQHTRIRFSINSDYVIKHFEPSTSTFEERIEAAGKIAEANYPLGFIVAPIIQYEGWKEGYKHLLEKLAKRLENVYVEDLTFELIQHRFTKVAKNVILKRYPKTKLDLDEENRQLKWGRYGRFKYVYPKEIADEMVELFETYIPEYFPQAEISYFV